MALGAIVESLELECLKYRNHGENTFSIKTRAWNYLVATGKTDRGEMENKIKVDTRWNYFLFNLKDVEAVLFIWKIYNYLDSPLKIVQETSVLKFTGRERSWE